MITAYALVAITIICSVICYYVAKRRKANAKLWCVIGACFGPLAIPFVFLSRPVNQYKTT